jgi:suppressor of ftsI
MPRPGISLAKALAMLVACQDPVAAQRAGPADPPPRCELGSVPLAIPYCAELVATADLPGIRGMLELHWVRSPFGVAVASDGRLRHRLIARIEGLPRADSLGGSRAFVAWAYDLQMSSEVRLGELRNGINHLGELPSEHFRVIVSAESTARAPRRGGRIVLRATSPAARMLAHRDAIAPLLATPAGDSSAHATHRAPWPMPAPDARIAPVAMSHAMPAETPWLPDESGPMPDAQPRQLVSLRNGDTLRLTAMTVSRTLGGKRFVMYGYNGQYPGPLVRVDERSEIVVEFRNAIDLPSTVHWHGVRLENRFDGVPHMTQDPVQPGGAFFYRVRFPDAGIFWYHPHVREDIQQELGLYGNILVAPARARAPVNREEVLALDDLLTTDGGGIMPFGSGTPTHALMGRFGNTMLINGEPRYTLAVDRGEIVRFYLTNVSNARIFNLRIPGARLKLIASDLGEFEREEWVESVVIAPAERYVVEAEFARAGAYPMLNSVMWLDHMRGTATPVADTLGVVVAGTRNTAPNHTAAFRKLKASRQMSADIAQFRAHFDRPIDHTLTLSVRLTGVAPGLATMLSGLAVPLDWNDGMPGMNWPLSGREVTWLLRDESGRENMAIDWKFKTGQVTKIRLINDLAASHVMTHPIHVHGQRFLVLSRNDVPNDNMTWKDTAVLPAGESMILLVEMSNPGKWMVHCHVAEHLGTGMMGGFTVEP